MIKVISEKFALIHFERDVMVWRRFRTRDVLDEMRSAKATPASVDELLEFVIEFSSRDFGKEFKITGVPEVIALSSCTKSRYGKELYTKIVFSKEKKLRKFNPGHGIDWCHFFLAVHE